MGWACALGEPVPSIPSVEPASENHTLTKSTPQSIVDTLDQHSIQIQYSDGEFDQVVKGLEAFRLAHEKIRREDSLIFCKYLGVIYTSNPATREKGKYWLYKLLQLEPQAELVDLYVSEDIQSVFDRVRREVVTRRHYQGINDTELGKSIQAANVKDTVVLRDTVVVQQATLPGALVGLASSLATPAPEFAGKEKENRLGWTFDVNVLLGLKWMDPISWKPIENQFAFQGSFDFRRVNWPINLSVDFTQTLTKEILQNNGSGILEKNQGFTQELFFGLRKFWDIRLLALRPFCELGLGLISVTFASDSFTAYQNHEFKQTGYGGWLGGGLYYELERHFNLGGHFWYSWAPIDYFDGSANGGGTGFGLMAGFHY